MKVLKFGAVWCSGCLVMRPRWQEIENEMPNLVTEYFDFDKDKDMVVKHSVDSKLPVFIFLDKKEEELFRLTGEVKKSELIKLINENIGK
ncbi:thioredoxin family protein [candidate division WWE3 bacterium]|uniref:Thioredoxin family protein n=1 Tax=candidate division WWE3 bacterium TaxID=2053526 RepID=A0A7X9E6M5_UNCKA|nr:thioredoxin family protein [candidate division WWE3 bacterium]